MNDGQHVYWALNPRNGGHVRFFSGPSPRDAVGVSCSRGAGGAFDRSEIPGLIEELQEMYDEYAQDLNRPASYLVEVQIPAELVSEEDPNHDHFATLIENRLAKKERHNHPEHGPFTKYTHDIKVISAKAMNKDGQPLS